MLPYYYCDLSWVVNGINNRKRKQKDIIMKLKDNLPNHYKDKKDYLLKLKDSIDIPIACIKCRKYGHHVTECKKEEKAKKEKDKKRKTKKKQDGVDIKLEIKEIEDNSTDINEQNIVEIVNLTGFTTIDIIMTNPPLEKEISHDQEIDHNKHNILSLIDSVIFQKWYTEVTLVINKEFSLTKVALIDSGVNMNCIQEGLISLKYYEKSSKRLT